ncbi:MAG TPA: type II toxin-antitoxin system RelE/ParE family toxin [Tepidisphaeraceae bacterium]|jgi:toxin ParE1/3/4
MPFVRRSQLAIEDYRNIWRYISVNNPDAADELLRTIDSKLELYAEHPYMGTVRDALSQGLRSFPVGRYVIFYRVVSDGIEVARVLHGSRDLQKFFG